MWETIKNEWQAKVAIALFFLLTIWWSIGLTNPSAYETRYFGDFPSIYGIMALWGGIWGVVVARQWGGWRSVLGKSIIMFSLGLFAQEFGQILYAYYSFYQHISVPYPSVGDVGYFGSIPLYIYGISLLAKASGVQIKLKSIESKIQAVLIPVAMLLVGYYLFLKGYEFDWSNPIKIFLDFGYPFGQAIYVSLAILVYLLSKGVLGGIMKSKVLLILVALVIQFLADYVFLYQSINGTWKVGGLNDYMYLCAYFLMTLSLMSLGTIFKRLQETK